MAAYALIENETVINTIEWDGVAYTPAADPTYDSNGVQLSAGTSASGWSPPDGQTVILIPDDVPVSIGWTYDGSKFIAPPAPPAPVLTPDQIKSANLNTQNALIATATLKIAIYTDATDPDLVDTVDPKDTAALKAWKQYRVAVNKVDLTQSEPTWPQVPQS